MNSINPVLLSEVVTEALPGFACGAEDPDGVLQIRMNNILRDGNLDLSKKRRVPSDIKAISRTLLRPGDVLFNATNSPDLVGKTALVKELSEPTVFSNHFLRLRTDGQRLSPAYLARWLSWQFGRGVFKGLVRQWVNQATVGRQELLSLWIPLPSLENQRHIATVLAQSSALLEKRRQSIALLDDLAQSIFTEMFGDLVENERAWPLGTISSLVRNFESGKSLAEGEDATESPYRILKISAVTSGRFKAHESKPAPKEYEPPKSHFVNGGDLLFSRANTSELIGATAFVPDGTENLLMPDKLWRFAWNYEDKPSPWFVHYLQAAAGP